MPNYCFNEITIKGPKAKVMELVNLMKGQGRHGDGKYEFDFNKAIPYPEHFQKMDDFATRFYNMNIRCKCMPIHDGYNKGGYDWCISNWGTKWNTMSSALNLKHYKNGNSVAHYSFDTAWSPCVPVVQALADRFLELKFKIHYKEEGVGFEETEKFNY